MWGKERCREEEIQEKEVEITQMNRSACSQLLKGPTCLNTPFLLGMPCFGLSKNCSAFNGEKNGSKPYLGNLLTVIKPSWESPRFTYL